MKTKPPPTVSSGRQKVREQKKQELRAAANGTLPGTHPLKPLQSLHFFSVSLLLDDDNANVYIIRLGIVSPPLFGNPCLSFYCCFWCHIHHEPQKHSSQQEQNHICMPARPVPFVCRSAIIRQFVLSSAASLSGSLSGTLKHLYQKG